MAIRIIKYTVSEGGIEPASQQFGGTQGDHNVTELKFTLSEPLMSAITSSAQGTVVYRFDGYDGSGGMRSTEPLELKDGVCEYALEEWVTRYGGIVQVYLVITDVTDTTEMELYSFPAVLNLKSRPNGHEVGEGSHESISTLYEATKKNADEVKGAVEDAEKLKDELQQSNQEFVDEIHESNEAFMKDVVEKTEIVEDLVERAESTLTQLNEKLGDIDAINGVLSTLVEGVVYDA